MTSGSSRPVPWLRRDIVFAVLCTLAGVGLILLAWSRSSREVRLEDNVSWLLLGSTGVLLAVFGDGAMILAGRRAVRRSRRTLHETEFVLADVVAPELLGDADRMQMLEAIPGLKRYHRPGCLLTAGKEASRASRAEHESADRLPCGACQP